MRRRPCLLALALAALPAAGCGGGDAEQLTAEQLIGRGDELCAEGRERFDEVQAQPPQNPREAVEQTDELIEIAADELKELRELRPPEELRDPYERYLEARGRALELLEQGRDAAESQDAGGYARAQTEAAAAAAKRAQLAQQVGFKVCSAPAGPRAG